MQQRQAFAASAAPRPFVAAQRDSASSVSAFTVALALDAHRAALGQHGLGAGVAVIGRVGRLVAARRVAQVVAQLAASTRSISAFFERHRGVLDRTGRHRPWANWSSSSLEIAGSAAVRAAIAAFLAFVLLVGKHAPG